MKMGTDAMLLGAWAEPPAGTTAVLDVGTGSGVLALMMAQKTQHQLPPAAVHAIDIDAAAVQQARTNAAASPWADRVHVHHCSLQNWCQNSLQDTSGQTSSQSNSHLKIQTDDSSGGDSGVAHSHQRYDMIISNPPYFLKSSKPDQGHRAAARHADLTLPFSELAVCAVQLLAPGGRLCVVLPAVEAGVLRREAAVAGLVLTRLTEVYMKSIDPQPKRHLMQFEAAAAAAAAEVQAGLQAAESRSSDSTSSTHDIDSSSGSSSNNSSSGGSSSSSGGGGGGSGGGSGLVVDKLVVLVPSTQAAAAAAAAAAGSLSSPSSIMSSTTDSTSSEDDSSSSSSNTDGSSGRPAAVAAAWVFSQQYRELTVNFHHPDLLA